MVSTEHIVQHGKHLHALIGRILRESSCKTCPEGKA